MISIIDYGVGNIMSVISAFEKIGAQVKIVCASWEVKEATHLVLPGVGAYGEGMAQLEKRGLASAIKEYVASGKPLLGICLGAQLLLSESEEFGRHQGLDIVKGKVVGFKKPQEVAVKGYRVPHVVWNTLTPASSLAWSNTILGDTPLNTKVYFIHSYYLVPDDQGTVLATTEYGGQKFCAVFKKGNIYGCQFHPEKSGEFGLDMLNLFANA
ncbi:MAG: imidazole glycerol phosphate synthase subunit HisH [Nanoarchaeota archaeon]|nr:imidazole glycerol phosphate synthase subunit HisH [Nanoarchaeota archaeon]